MAMSAGGSSGGVTSDINVTPMIDVLLVLLIFFMSITSSQVLKVDKNISLPDIANYKPAWVLQRGQEKKIAEYRRRIQLCDPVGDFVNNHPSLQVLGLSFLIMIGFMLIAEASHNSELSILGNHIGAIPKGYLYFAIAFSVGVEFLNIRIRKRS